MQIPEEYQGREQSYLKHRVLKEYLLAWGHKLLSRGRRGRVRLCYVDAFAGPWKAQSDALEDTSIAIGLHALESATHTWRQQGADVVVEAAFVEKSEAAFRELSRFLESRTGSVRTVARHGEFGTFVPELHRWLGNDAGLIFVDPTGWKGAAMRFIAPLVADCGHRDVLINVMFDHINRFKDDARAFLRQQMRDFFGLGSGDLPEGLDEGRLFELYRQNLKGRCGLRYAADLAIPRPTTDRTVFHLVVGGQAPAVLSLFRDIEKKVIGAEAAGVRATASVRESEKRTGQLTLIHAPLAMDARYGSLHDQAIRDAPSALLAKLDSSRAIEFGSLWPGLLEALHMTRSELGRVGWELYEAGRIVISNRTNRERSLKDHHLVLKG
jgi:three-Cys-motif partner protein